MDHVSSSFSLWRLLYGVFVCVVLIRMHMECSSLEMIGVYM